MPVFTGKSQERQSRLTRDSALTLREILSEGRLEPKDRILLRTPAFFFGDSIKEYDEDLYDGEYKWLCQIGNRRFFLPNMEQMFPLSYLQSMLLHKQMDWDLTWLQSEVSIERIFNHGAFPVGHSRDMIGLLPGLVGQEKCWNLILMIHLWSHFIGALSHKFIQEFYMLKTSQE